MTNAGYTSGAVIALILVVYATACKQEARTDEAVQKTETISTNDKASLEKGKLLFATNCQSCHLLPIPGKLP
jgi:cytochrome c5